MRDNKDHCMGCYFALRYMLEHESKKALEERIDILSLENTQLKEELKKTTQKHSGQIRIKECSCSVVNEPYETLKTEIKKKKMEQSPLEKLPPEANQLLNIDRIVPVIVPLL